MRSSSIEFKFPPLRDLTASRQSKEDGPLSQLTRRRSLRTSHSTGFNLDRLAPKEVHDETRQSAYIFTGGSRPDRRRAPSVVPDIGSGTRSARASADDADTNSNTDTNSNSDTDTDTDTNSNSNSNSDSNADSNSDSNADSNSDSNAAASY